MIAARNYTDKTAAVSPSPVPDLQIPYMKFIYEVYSQQVQTICEKKEKKKEKYNMTNKMTNNAKQVLHYYYGKQNIQTLKQRIGKKRSNVLPHLTLTLNMGPCSIQMLGPCQPSPFYSVVSGCTEQNISVIIMNTYIRQKKSTNRQKEQTIYNSRQYNAVNRCIQQILKCIIVYQYPSVSVTAKYYSINFSAFCCILNRIVWIRLTTTIPTC